MALIVTLYMTISTIIFLLVCRIAGKMSMIEEEQERRYLRKRGLNPEVVLDDTEELAAYENGEGKGADGMRPLAR